MNSSEFSIQAHTEAARGLLASLKLLFGEDDSQLLADAVEGETGLLEAIDTVLAEIDETEVLVGGLKEKETQFAKRRRTMEERIQRLRALIEQAMVITEQMRLRRPTATLSLRRIPPDVVVVSEADIPSEYFIPQPLPPPKLDKAALRLALNACAERIADLERIGDAEERAAALASIKPIPGATLSNGSLSLQTRRS